MDIVMYGVAFNIIAVTLVNNGPFVQQGLLKWTQDWRESFVFD